MKHLFQCILSVLVLFTGSLFSGELQGNQEVLKMRENWLSAIAEPQEQSREVFAWFSTVPHWRFNCIINFSYEDKLEEHLDALIDKAPQSVPVSVWLDPQDDNAAFIEVLKSRNFVVGGIYPSMSWDVQPIEVPDLDIRAVNVEEFHEVYAVCSSYSEELRQGAINLLKDRSGDLFLAYLDGKPVGTGTLFVHGDVGMVFHLATLPEYQRRGIGRAMMHYIMNQASKRGLKKLVLNSSSVAEKLYYSLNFQKVGEVVVYVKKP